jgi:hypothetical protein
MKLACLFVCLIVAPAQDLELKRQIEAENRIVYKDAQTRVFRLANHCPPALKLCEVTGFYLGDSLRRVVVAGWEDRGRRAAEYYLRDGAVTFIYETLEYLPEQAPTGAWRNFKGLPAWERRAYFRDGKAGHVETEGSGDFPPNDVTVRELRGLLER